MCCHEGRPVITYCTGLEHPKTLAVLDYDGHSSPFLVYCSRFVLLCIFQPVPQEFGYYISLYYHYFFILPNS